MIITIPILNLGTKLITACKSIRYGNIWNLFTYIDLLKWVYGRVVTSIIFYGIKLFFIALTSTAVTVNNYTPQFYDDVITYLVLISMLYWFSKTLLVKKRAPPPLHLPISFRVTSPAPVNHRIVTLQPQQVLGLYSISNKTSSRQISQSLEAARFGIIMILPL